MIVIVIVVLVGLMTNPKVGRRFCSAFLEVSDGRSRTYDACHTHGRCGECTRCEHGVKPLVEKAELNVSQHLEKNKRGKVVTTT